MAFLARVCQGMDTVYTIVFTSGGRFLHDTTATTSNMSNNALPVTDVSGLGVDVERAFVTSLDARFSTLQHYAGFHSNYQQGAGRCFVFDVVLLPPMSDLEKYKATDVVSEGVKVHSLVSRLDLFFMLESCNSG